MNNDLLDIEDAAKLIYYGLENNYRYIHDSGYINLLEKYQNDTQFQNIVRSIGVGLKIKVLAIEDFGVILHPLEDSIFTSTLKDYELNIKSEQKKVWGLILLAIAAYYYPTKESFDYISPIEIKRFTIEMIDEFLRTKCESLKKQLESIDVPSDHPELEVMYNNYLNIIQVDSRIEKSRSTTLSKIKKVFEYLLTQGLMRKNIETDEYISHPKFNLLIEELAKNEYFKIFINEINEEKNAKN